MHVCGDRNAWCCTHGFCTETSRRSARAYYMPFHFVYMCFWLFFVFVFRPAAVALHIFCVLIFSLFLFYSHAKIELTTWCGRHMHSTKHVRDCLFNIHNRFVVFFFRVWVRANEHKVRRMMMAMCRAIWHCIHTRIRAYTHDHSTFAMFHSVCVCVYSIEYILFYIYYNCSIQCAYLHFFPSLFQHYCFAAFAPWLSPVAIHLSWCVLIQICYMMDAVANNNSPAHAAFGWMALAQQCVMHLAL